ncbi:hypothetical protein ABGT16_23605, partial [Pseudomonas asiatica]|uniref:hypothetical protein n=1 Tax=Pseudomonas asiatica TaxID=2219225 RepID=UPI00345DBE2C
MLTLLLMPTLESEERRAKSEERRAKSEKRKSTGLDLAHSPFTMATLTHLFALTASHFLSNATKSNQKTLRSHHPAPPLR